MADYSLRESTTAAAAGPRTAAVRPRDWASTLLFLVPAGCYYFFLLSAGSAGFFAPAPPHGLTFNSMLLHLLQGRFDVDPAAIGDEGFLRNGATYAYFGILPALFRAPFLGLPDFAATDFTRLGCLVAVLLMAGFKVMTALTIARRVGAEGAPILLTLLVAAILAGGAQIEFLRPSIFQETALWAAACAAAFVCLFVRGWLRQAGFTPLLLAGLALAAGLCLLARVSTALGLYVAFGLLWLRLVWREHRAGGMRLDRATIGRYGTPAAILLGFAAVAGGINQARWGNPLVFVDLSKQLIALSQYPDRLARVQEYGEFNPARLPYALGYYFLPLWVLRDGAGELLWSGYQQRMFDLVELPPGSFLVSDPLLIGLAVYGIVQLVRRNALPRRDLLLPVLGGLLVPIGLMLTAIALAYRYRLEFYPFLELCAFAGFARLLAAPGRRAHAWIAGGTLAGIAPAHAMWLLYMLSPFGPAATVLGPQGIAAFYGAMLR